MPITIDGTGSISGLLAGGLPDGSVTTSEIAASAVTTGKIAGDAITAGKLDGGQSGSAPIYAARAWVNFNGTGTVAIRQSGNVTSITDNGVGLYTINFTTAMSDATYSIVGACSPDTTSGRQTRGIHPLSYSAGSVQINTVSTANSEDQQFVNVAIFR